MSLADEKKATITWLTLRISRYEAEAQHLQQLIVHAKALLEAASISVGPTNGYRLPREEPIPSHVDKVIPQVDTIRFMQVVEAVAARLSEPKDRIELAKVVNSALQRAVRKGKLQRIARGVYRRGIEQLGAKS